MDITEVKKTFNRHQPIRPLINPETGSPLLHRTFPRLEVRMPAIMTLPYQICQMRMYRHCVNGEFPNHASAAEVREWLNVGRNTLGSTILQSVRYEARKLVNRRSLPKALVIYSFNDILELQYGLEWQICTWLRTFLKERDAQEIAYSGPEAAEHELEIMATVSHQEYMVEYEDPLWLMQEMFREKNLSMNWEKLCIGLEEIQPMAEATYEPKPPPKAVI